MLKGPSEPTEEAEIGGPPTELAMETQSWPGAEYFLGIVCKMLQTNSINRIATYEKTNDTSKKNNSEMDLIGGSKGK